MLFRSLSLCLSLSSSLSLSLCLSLSLPLSPPLFLMKARGCSGLSEDSGLVVWRPGLLKHWEDRQLPGRKDLLQGFINAALTETNTSLSLSLCVSWLSLSLSLSFFLSLSLSPSLPLSLCQFLCLSLSSPSDSRLYPPLSPVSFCGARR